MTELAPSRRSFITGLISLVAAPAIVRAGSLMPVKQMIELPGPSSTEGRFVSYEEFRGFESLFNPIRNHFAGINRDPQPWWKNAGITVYS